MLGFCSVLLQLWGERFLPWLLIIATVTVTKVLEGSWRDLSTFLQKGSRLQTVAAVAVHISYLNSVHVNVILKD